MKSKIILSILITLVFIGASLGSGIVIRNETINEKDEYSTPIVDTSGSNDKNIVPYTINFVPIDKQQCLKKNDETQLSEHTTGNPTIEKGRVVKTNDNCSCSNKFKKPDTVFENIDSSLFDEYFAYQEYCKAHKAENNFKFNGSLEKIPIPQDNPRSVLYPPWYDSGDGTEQTNWWAFHSEESWVNEYTGEGYVELVGSCGLAQWVISHAWCWCEGYYDCTQTDQYDVNFNINYDGLVECFDFPVDVGLAKLVIEANVAYQLSEQPVETDLIFYQDGWPGWPTEYTIPGPYDPPGPYEIGYSQYVTLYAGYRYYFVVQFNVYLDCAAFGFCVSGGGISLDNWFLSANFNGQTPPAEVDLVSQGMVEISGEWYYAIWTDPFYFSPGSTVDLYACIWNNGPDAANDFYVGIGLDDQGYAGGPFDCDPGGVENPVCFYLPDFVWPNDLNTHYIWCYADVYDDIAETNEDNNFGSIEWAAVGPPNIEITDITLMKYNENTWPPDLGDIDWANPDPFTVGDRVIPLANISNNGDGPSFDMAVQYYEDDVLMAEGTFTLGADSWFIMYIEDGSGDPGFVWDNPNCMDIRWEIHDYDYGQDDSQEETYCPIPEEYTITFQTDPTNGGTITFDSNTYSNGQTTQKPDGTYSITANPATNYIFNYWSSTGGVSVSNPSSQTTTATISADGTLTAHFTYSPTQKTITFYTDPTNGGTITFDSNTYSNGQTTQKPPGQYPIIANPAATYTFDHWTSTCGTVTDPNSASTTVTVNSDGSLTAYFISSTNQPPDPPIILGPANGIAGTSYSYTFTSTDPDGDDVSFYILWGDGDGVPWTEFWPSGSPYSHSHSWAIKGSYTIQAKAKDIYGAESDWATLDVTMPYSYDVPLIQFWERLFERFPHAFPILRYLLGY